MVYKRFCVICGTVFETTNGYKATCSDLCSRRREQEGQKSVYRILDAAVPDALAELGLDSIDEYPAWKREQSRGEVYFIQAEDGPIKIGFSKDASARLTDLQIASPSALSLLATIEAYPECEAELHHRFNGYHIRGEWFRAGAELLDYIACL